MNDADTLVRRIVCALRDAGFSAFAEFERGGQAVPAQACFITVGVIKIEQDEQIPDQSGFALPLTAELRLRIHARTTDALDALRLAAVSTLLALRDPHCAVIRTEGCGYQKQTDRLCEDLHLLTCAMLHCQEEATQ